MPLSTNLPFSVAEVVHGVRISDPYRWLENRDTPQTEEWLQEQSCHFNTYFAECPYLAELEFRVQAYLDVTTLDQPARVGDRHFYRKRNRGEEQGSIYVRNEITDEERLLVAPACNERFVSVGIHRISEDGRFLAYELKHGGEDQNEIHIVDTRSGAVLPDTIPRGHSRGFVFSPQNDGYFYIQETGAVGHEHELCRHRFGQVGNDVVVFRAPRSNGSRLILTANAMRLGAIWLRPKGCRVLSDFSILSFESESQWITVFREKAVPYNPILLHGRILVRSETHSRDSQLIEISQDGSELRRLVPPRGMPIRQCAITRDRLFVNYLDPSVSTIEAWDFEGRQLKSVEVPSGGTVSLLSAHSQNSDSFFYSYQSYDCPPSIFEYSVRAGTSTLWHQRHPPRPNWRCHTREATFTSKDGSSIPVTLVSAEHESHDASRPAIMTSYGGFGVAMTPQFSVLVTIMMELGAVFVLPHVRGGGEFGKAWHEAGRRKNKQTTFDDFIAAAEWLYREGIATPERLAIFGGSNSGLLVACAMTQRPDLFGAVLSIAPLIDMVRYEQFDDAAQWRSEFGTTEDPEDFRALYSYSPYHRVRADINYPATLFVSGDKDDRCNPAHTRKMVARLQERPAQLSPIILDYSEERGHSPVLPVFVRVRALARRIAFLCRQLNITLLEGGNCETSRS